jgi:hypothetical protein
MNEFEITLTQAQNMTSAYQNDETFDGLTKAVYIDKESLMDLLDQENATGLRFFFALDSNEALNVVAVGTKEDGDVDLTGGVLLGNLKRCPYLCDNNSVLLT